MLDTINYRGPDESSEYHFEGYHVGMCRLSINDPAQGHQPLFNNDKSVVLMYNGEIYNSPSLREKLQRQGYIFRTRSDGEVICHLYDEYGENLFKHLDGMFAVALWDKSRRCLLLARDYAGEKPLYYSEIDAGDGVVFGSELKAIRTFDGIDLTLNRQALWDFPTFLWIPEPETVYTNIRAVPAGHCLKFDAAGKSLLPYRPLLSDALLDTSGDEEVISTTRRVVSEAVRSRLLSDVPIGSFLSGGLDSSIVATLATRELGSIDTFSVGFERLADPYHGVSDESEAAASYAATLGSRHHAIHVTAKLFRDDLDHFCRHGDQPFAVSSGLGILAVARAAREAGIKVILSGDCADECFGGYSWYAHLPLAYVSRDNRFDDQVISYQNFGMRDTERLEVLAGYSAQQRAWAWHYYAHENEKAGLYAREWREGLKSSLLHLEAFNPASQWDPEGYVANDRALYMPNEMLRKLDRMTMAHSVEGRVPFAAPTVLALAEKLKYSQMVRGHTLKWALREAFSDVLPDSIVERPKHGFNVPIDHWLKGEWRDLVDEAFAPDSALWTHGLVDAQSGVTATRLLKDPQRLNGHTIFSFIVLNRWLELSK